ncbi:hypothetical protein SAMN05421832_1351 [Psychrobacillus psychrodurans]|nr:hypothetical protein SAMN05421832_1351 [Psychrobacillus psychrodurans]
MKPYLIVLSIAILVAVFNIILDVPTHIYIILIISTIISFIFTGMKDNSKK